MEYKLEGARPKGRPKKTWREIVEKACQARKLNREDAMDHVLLQLLYGPLDFVRDYSSELVPER